MTNRPQDLWIVTWCLYMIGTRIPSESSGSGINGLYEFQNLDISWTRHIIGLVLDDLRNNLVLIVLKIEFKLSLTHI